MTSTLFLANGRTALAIAFRQLGILPGSKILVPDFVCDVVIHPIVSAGLTPVYYPVTQKLEPDWSALETISSGSGFRALIMIHYFGQPQDVDRFRSFCGRYKVLLIEDNAHGYGGSLQGQSLGTLGDIGFSSPRKFLSTPSGGALHNANESSREIARQLMPYPAFRWASLMKTALRLCPPAWRSVKSRIDRSRDWRNPLLFREDVQPSYGIDQYSRRRIESADWQIIARRRRDCWAAWENVVRQRGLQTVYPSVHGESCPWAMPAYVSSVEERDDWLIWGAQHGVPLFPWPSLPASVVATKGRAFARWESMVCFPLDVFPGHVDTMP